MHLVCRLCDSEVTLLERYENMPARAQYLPDEQSVGSDRGITLSVYQCTACALVQLGNEPVPYWREVIRSNHLSPDMENFRREQFMGWIGENALDGKRVIEIGSGQGEYIEMLKSFGLDAHGMRTIEDRPNTTLQFDGFLLLNSLEHVPNPRALLATVRRLVVDGATGIIEVPNFDMILERGLVSEFMVDHLTYFTHATLRRTLEMNGFDVLEIDDEWHGYILSATVRKRAPLQLPTPNLAFLPAGNFAIWGAGHQALAMMALMGLDAKRVKYVVDSSTEKQGRYTPVTHIPIVPPECLATDPVETLVIMCGSYSEEVARSAQRYPGMDVVVL